jgi:hypothetical protein
MRMTVNESRQQFPALQVDLPDAGAGNRAAIVGYGQDPAAAHEYMAQP